MLIDNLLIDASHYAFIEALSSNDIKVTSEARCYWVLASCRWAHCSYKQKIGNFNELVCFAIVVVPWSVIHPLSEQLNGGLSSLLFDLWHVHVIDEYDQLFIATWSIVTTLFLLKFLSDLPLCAISWRLSTETNVQWIELFSIHIFQILYYSDSLACSSRSNE